MPTSVEGASFLSSISLAAARALFSLDEVRLRIVALESLLLVDRTLYESTFSLKRSVFAIKLRRICYLLVGVLFCQEPQTLTLAWHSLNYLNRIFLLF